MVKPEPPGQARPRRCAGGGVAWIRARPSGRWI